MTLQKCRFIYWESSTYPAYVVHGSYHISRNSILLSSFNKKSRQEILQAYKLTLIANYYIHTKKQRFMCTQQTQGQFSNQPRASPVDAMPKRRRYQRRNSVVKSMIFAQVSQIIEMESKMENIIEKEEPNALTK